MKFYLSALLFLATTIASAQSQPASPKTRPDSIAYYMRDETKMAYDDKDARFVRLVIKANQGFYRINDYYMNGNLRLATLTTLDSMNFEAGAQGICYEYYDNGKRKSIKTYEKGKIEGDVANYYKNGGLMSVETYSSNGIYLKQFLDSVGNTLTQDGNGKWFKFEDESKDYSEGNVLNGKEDGEWKRAIGDSVLIIVYKQGNVIKGGENLRRKVSDFEPVAISPSFPGGDAAFAKFISRKLTYPTTAKERNIQGRVILNFVVEKDGSLTGIKVIRHLGGGCDDEAIRVVSLSPRWNPGKKIDGQPVRVQYSMPINFNLIEYNNPHNANQAVPRSIWDHNHN